MSARLSVKRVRKIGVEMEGGWRINPPDTRVYGDGSVSVVAPIIGEIQSPPCASLRYLEEFIERNYPSVVNESCGFHIHISTKRRIDYSRLMDIEFFEFFQKEMERFGEMVPIHHSHPFWGRLRGLNTFCRKVWCPDIQVLAKNKCGPRYTQLNYAYRCHGTLECRMLPMFGTAHEAIQALRFYIRTVERYLRGKHREKAKIATVTWSELNKGLEIAAKKERRFVDVETQAKKESQCVSLS